MLDFIIVGQGIAGTLLAHFLLEKNNKIRIIDPGLPGSATKVAAGIINPVTGRRYVKSWKIEALLPFAERTYTDLEKKFDIKIYHKKNIIRSLFNSREENDWLVRSGEAGYEKYMLDEVDLGKYQTTTELAYSYGEVQYSAQVDIGKLAFHYRQLFLEQQQLLQETFDFSKLKINENTVQYGDLSARNIVFCEGHGVKNNPFFNYLPFGGAKGEVLIIKLKDPSQYQKILKHRVFIVPLENDTYWIGATYDWDFENAQPTANGKSFLIERLEDFLKIPFEIVTHKAAIRPTVKDRRPILGYHPEFAPLAIFNGLGTKGASLGPYWANHMANFLDGEELEESVSIGRFGRSEF